MKPVLCALDFSNSSASILKVACEMATQKNTSLIVLFAYRLIPKNEEIDSYRKAVVQKAKEQFAFLEKELKLYGSVPYEFRAEVGFLSDRINALTQKNPIGLIVMGQKLAGSINDHKGLSLQQFIDSAKAPVLIVPEAQEQQ